MDFKLYLLYLAPAVVIWIIYAARRSIKHRAYRKIQQENLEAGLTQPASLHPLIDESQCIGCGSCVAACPESNVLGLIDGKAELISPANCIGHGACKVACPIDAITLVFGTAERGIELPEVKPSFETNVDGIFIAGELGGMGLVRNAIEQGKQAMESAAQRCKASHKADYDVIIVGAGPAGIAASLAAKENKLKYLTLEQDSLGGTVYHFPRNKIVMTAPAKLPLVGKMNFRETTKESLLEYWRKIVDQAELVINTSERLDSVDNKGEHFEVGTTKGSYTGRSLLLCLGRRGTPRKLGVDGEDQPKVVYSLSDPEQYRGQHVLVVGGGDSALEAALDIADTGDSVVHLAYRGDSFGRAKSKNRQRIGAAEAHQKLTVLFKTTPKAIEEKEVILEQSGSELKLKNDAVIVCAGGILPTPFLKEIGIQVETKYGAA